MCVRPEAIADPELSSNHPRRRHWTTFGMRSRWRCPSRSLRLVRRALQPGHRRSSPHLPTYAVLRANPEPRLAKYRLVVSRVSSAVASHLPMRFHALAVARFTRAGGIAPSKVSVWEHLQHERRDGSSEAWEAGVHPKMTASTASQFRSFPLIPPRQQA
jgi:hypothetical protein